MSIRIVQQDDPHTPDIGDYLYGHEYMMARPDELLQTCNIMCLSHFAYNPWRALDNLGIDLDSLGRFIDRILAEDDLFDDTRTYYGVIPTALFTNDAVQYKTGKAPYEKMALDTDWNRDVAYRSYLEGESCDPPQWARSMMGSGYTIYTQPSDGGGGIEYGYVGLSNNDVLLCYVNEWYNK